METIIDKIDKINTEYEKHFESNEQFSKLKDYFEDAKSKGLLKPESYNIPPIDTIGKRYFQINEHLIK